VAVTEKSGAGTVARRRRLPARVAALAAANAALVVAGGISAGVLATGSTSIASPPIAGGSAAAGTASSASPQQVSGQFLKAAAAGNCAQMLATTTPKSAMRNQLSSKAFCSREALIFRGFTVLSTKLNGKAGKTTAAVTVRAHSKLGSFDVEVQTARLNGAWVVSLIS
jgi:hypothetical protein